MVDGSLSAKISSAPSDPIFGIVEAFRADPRPEKINLAAGVYMEENGVTPILASVREAERRLLANSTTKLYKPIGGDPALVKLMRALIFREPGAPFGTLPMLAGRLTALVQFGSCMRRTRELEALKSQSGRRPIEQGNGDAEGRTLRIDAGHPLPTRRSGRRPATDGTVGLPRFSMVTEPVSGSRRPTMHEMVVVLPAPFGPSSP